MPQETVDGFRLSPQQERLWLLQCSDRSAAYNSQCVVLVRGRLDGRTLEGAWAEVVERNEILRTTFYCLPEMTLPIQVIGEGGLASPHPVDLSGLAETEQLAQLAELSEGERGRAFDFERGPLHRVVLTRLDDERHALVVTLPAMCADAASLHNLVAELARTYEAHADRGALEDDPLQYADLSEWLNELLEAEETSAGRDYWRKQQALPGREPRLPSERSAPAGAPFETDIKRLALGDAVACGLRELAGRFQTSTDLLLQACWHVLLWRLTREPEVMVGTEFSGRRVEELRSALGLVARSLPVRTMVGDGLSFREVLGQVSEQNRRAAAWQDSFQWERFDEGAAGPGTAPCLAVGYGFVESWPPLSAAGLTFSLHEQYTAFHRYKVKLQAVSLGQALAVEFHYDRHYFAAPAVERLAAQFAQLVESLLACPEATVQQLDILGEDERQLVLREFNRTAAEFAAPRLLHALFERQAAATPDAVAAVYEGEQLTYRELNERANRLAHRLAELGAGPDVPVAISLGRSLEMITGLLAILKAGAAYLPLDPLLPTGRISVILADAGARLVLTRHDACEALPADAERLYLDEWSEFAGRSADKPRSAVTPNNLAYIIYTSGSTGAPKGVMISHRAITNRVLWMQQTFPAGPGDTLLQKTIFSFDASVWELFVPLFAGARLLLAGPEGHRDTAEMIRAIREHGVTLLQLTPTLLRVLLGEHDVEECRTLRRVYCGGEALPSDTAALFYRKLGQAELVNLYGPTEVSIDATYYECPREEEGREAGGLVPIGRPLSNVRVYVLDALLRPAPVSVAGELYVGGAGLARGYLGRPDMTAERFVPDPFSAEPGARLYHTGDLARHLEDGRVEFLGRIDHQVKVRGFRIEPGEIETVLGRHAGVREVVVAVREDVPGDSRLVAYVVPSLRSPSASDRLLLRQPHGAQITHVNRDEAEVLDEEVHKGEGHTNGGAAPREVRACDAASAGNGLPTTTNGHVVTAGELQAYLSEQLPDYMVPSAFVLLDELPTLPSGKVDRKALPAPEALQRDPGKFLAARTPVEEVLAGIWSQLFGASPVGLHDNFFDLGGHSLMVTQVMSRVRQLFNVSIPLRSLFEGPTIAQLAERVEATLRQGEGLNVPPIHPVEREGRRPPLSFGQQRLWFLQQLDPGSPVYNLPSAIRLEGPLDLAVLRRTLDENVRRHESLRTTFDVEDGRPVQVIHPPAPMELPVTDLSKLPEGLRESHARQLAGEESLKPFDLSAGPLMRVRLLKLGEEEHVALLTMHHIISDGWSSGVLVQEIGTLYEAFAKGEESPLPELPVQYADYAVWQREWLQGEELERQLAYWKKQLAGELPVLQLPLARPRPAVQTFNGASQTVGFPRHLTRSLKALSREEGATLFMTLLAAFQSLLHRYTGHDDIPVGTPIANRNHSEIEPLIGFFANTLVLRADLSGDPTFRELLGRVREMALGAYAHQDLPFEKLVEELQPGRELSHSPLFQVMFMLNNAPALALELPSIQVGFFNPEGGTAKFDLTLAMADAGDELLGTLGYNTDLFDAATIARLLRHFQHLVEAVVGEPDRQLSGLRLFDEDERGQLLYEWNDAARRDYPAGRCIHDLFERQAALTPDATAVVAHDAELSYGELDAHASRLAARLRDLGVGAEVRVGVLLGRSSRVLSSILAVLKAGGAHVPLDPNYPLQRLRFMLADSGARIVLTEREQVERWREEGLLAEVEQVVVVDGEWETGEGVSAVRARGQATPQNLAYVIYTSGSTGTPKGIAITHASAVTLLDWARETFDRDDLSGVLAATSICFDLSVYELLVPLAVGGQVIIAENVLEWPAAAADRVRLVNTVPSVMAELLRGSGGRLPIGVRVVNLAGEALPRALVEAVYDAGEVKQVWNLYGPSEDTTYSTAALIERGGAMPPIGRPVANTRAYILDKSLEPVPVGVAGELYLGGEGLARGYLGRPELTAERFVPDPFSREPGERMYLTGDLARYLPDGQIEYLGRADQQVKIHGFRIELGEIEAVLSKNERIGEVIVTAREDVPGEKRVVAYYTVRGAAAPSAAELRAYVRDLLPDYMTPSAFIELGEMPLTPSGKVDRRALPAPGAAATDGAGYIAPRTATEEIVAGICAEVLGAERVGAADNFFDLGGHSLLATQAVARIRQSFGVELPLRKVFERPTVEALSVEIEALVRETRGTPPIPPLVPAPRVWGMPLSFAQQRLWFLNQFEPDSPFYNVTTAVRFAGALDVAAFERTVNEVVRRHETLRTTFASEDGHPVQVIAPQLVLDVPVLSLEEVPADEREERANRLAVEESRRPFSLESGPLFRASLLRLGEEEHVIILGMHHIISDAWSLTVLLQELTTLYEAFTKGEESPIAELPIQYADYAHWQRSWLEGEELERQLAYWRAHLIGAPPLLELPLDRPRPSAQTYNGSHASVEIRAEVGERLKELSRRSGATLFMTLLAAFKALLARYSGQTDIVVGSPIANRRSVEVEKLIGFFTNTLVLRTDLSGDLTFRELLGRVRDIALGAYAHQDLPFEKLVEELEPEREMSHSPLFQVMFGVRNVSTPGAALSEGNVRPLVAESGSSKFDLSLFISDDDVLRGQVEYNTDLFDHDTIARMIGHFKQLLASIAADPDQRIDDLQMLRVDERRQLLDEWNRTDVIAQRNLSLVQLLQQAFEKIPATATAVVFENESMTYAELNERANRLANRLRRLGVGPDSLVGIGMERSPEMIVALLAVIKADGAYVPLDLSHPTERLAVMLEDARPLVLLTQERLAEGLPEHSSQVVFVDAEWASIAGESRDAPWSRTTADNLGYVIYTSGSTGKPKGVAMTQGPLSNLIAWQSHALPSRGARTLQFASIGFDVSFQEIFTTLFSGGAVVLISEETRLDARALLGVIVEQQVERMFLPVVGLQQLAEAAAETGVVPRSLRDVTTSGDRLQITKPISNWFSKLSGCTMHNECGPTESHSVAAHTLEDETSLWPALPPIGRPIDNARLYILDGRLNPVPPGVAGELYIGGKCLARGYLNQPGLTADRFLPDLFSVEPGARLYKTGDLARFQTGGSIDLIGRNDFQVKLRGFRVELGEIQSLLGEHPTVHEAVAVMREDSPGQKQIVAYVVAAEGAENTPAELRSFLKQRLPDYMVPSAIVLLDQLPLNRNGKVDRRALPAPDPPHHGREAYLAARTPVEEVLAGIYAAVVGVEHAGATDNFFDLGGHSLLATLVISRIRDAFNVELPLRSMFEEPTVAGLARLVEAELFAGRKIQVPPIVPVVRGARAPLTFLQEHFWHRAQTAAPTFYHIETQLTGALDVAAFERTLGEMVRRQEILRTTFEEANGRLVQVVHDYEPTSLPFVDLGGLAPEVQGREVERRSALQVEPPFELSRGPLIRASLLRLGEGEHVLLLSIAHIIADAWSLKLFSQDVATLYEAFSRGKPSPLPELPIRYADYAHWQRSWLQGEELERQLSYWREHLAGVPPLLELPLDRPRPPVQSFLGSHTSVEVEAEVGERLKELSRREGVTLFMTLLAAFKALLARYSGQSDIVVGTATAGRSQVVTEGVIGIFVNRVMMRTDLSGDLTFRELLGRVREMALGAYAHQETPFEVLLEALGPPESSNYSPVAQVAFVLSSREETEVTAAQTGGLRMVPKPVYTGRPPYDLIMRMTETREKLVASLEYNTEIFEGETITRLLEDNLLLLRQIVADPDARLSSFELSWNPGRRRATETGS